MKEAKFLFGDIVVIEDSRIGVIVKTWERGGAAKPGFFYEVYVRSYNSIRDYDEKFIQRYKVRHKELDGNELYYQNI